MDDRGFTDASGPAGHGANDASNDTLDATRGINLGGLLGGLLGGEQADEGAAFTSDAGDLGDLLAALLGGGDAIDLSEQANNLGVSPSIMQAIVPLIAGALLGQGQDDDSRTALSNLAQGKAGAADALTGTGLLQEIMRRTGLDKKGALRIITAVLKALGIGATSKSKPKAKPKPKPKPASSAKPKAKPKPKPAASASTKPKPKPASSAKPKAKPKPRTKRTGEVDMSGERAQDAAD